MSALPGEHTAERGEQAAALGDRLRRIRRQQGLSLADVQTRSDGRWKAVVIGAYERGDRTITIARLRELAEFYAVPLVDLLPAPPAPRILPSNPGQHPAPNGTANGHAANGNGQAAAPTNGNGHGRRRYVLNLAELDAARLERRPHLKPIARFAAQVRQRRGDHNGRVLTVRASDLEALALTIGQDIDVLVKRLHADGALRDSA